MVPEEMIFEYFSVFNHLVAVATSLIVQFALISCGWYRLTIAWMKVFKFKNPEI